MRLSQRKYYPIKHIASINHVSQKVIGCRSLYQVLRALGRLRLFTQMYGPAPIRSLDGYLYYLIFVDHFLKYIWLYPLKNKSDVSIIFPKFKSIVEKYFNLPIISLYSDNGGEYIKLKSYLSSNGISHYTSPPHTPELNASAERRHHHIVETARVLLNYANLPSQLWSFCIQHRSLLNQQTTNTHS